MPTAQRQRRFVRQPQGNFPKLRPGFADAVLVYLPSVALAQTPKQGVTTATGVLPVPVNLFGSVLAGFGLADSQTINGTAALDFSVTGFTVLAVGSYPSTAGGTQPIECLVNRKAASAAGGFTMTLYNTFGGTPANVWSSYDKAGTDTNYDSFWVNGVKAASGNGNPATVTGARYALAGNAASGPGAGSVDLVIGRINGGTSDSQTQVELVAIWPRKFNEALMRQITLDPYSVFQPAQRLPALSISGPVTLTLTGVTGTASVGTLSPVVSTTLSGSTGTASTGTISPNIGYVLSGTLATASVGTITYGIGVPVQGNTSTASVGVLAPNVSTTLAGVTGTSSVGTVTATQGNVTYTLSGVTGTASVGTVSPAVDYFLTGLSSTGSTNNPTPSVGVPLSGVTANGTLGTPSTFVDYFLAGVIATGTAGVVTASTGGTSVNLAGVTGTASVGSPGVNVTYLLAGVVAVGSVGNVTQSGGTPAGGSGSGITWFPSVADFGSVSSSPFASISPPKHS